MIWLLIIAQIILIQVGWWVYGSYFTQPKHNHPSIFWNPIARMLLVYGPTIGIIGTIALAFYLTDHGGLFLVLTLIWWGYSGYKRKKVSGGHENFMPILTEGGVKIAPSSSEDLLSDIRAHKNEVLNANTRSDSGPKIEDHPIPKLEWLVERVQLEDIIDGTFSEKSRMILPLSPSKSEEWLRLQNHILPDDEIWTFSSMMSKVKSPYHWLGICLIRQGEVADYISEQMHISYGRRY